MSNLRRINVILSLEIFGISITESIFLLNAIRFPDSSLDH